MPETPPRASLLLRVPPELKARLVAHAARLGVSANAAAATLLDRALRAEERKAQR